jgi:hypothetical protein
LPFPLMLMVVLRAWWIVPVGAIALQLLIGLANLGEDHGWNCKDYGEPKDE